MKFIEGLKNVLVGLLTALVSSGIVASSLLISLAEGEQSFIPAEEPSATTTSTSSPTPSQAPPATVRATASAFPRTTNSASVTSTLPPTPSGCPPPPGWSPVTISPGDTLNGLAAAYGITPEELAQANCLTVSRLVPGSVLYVPSPPPPLPLPDCGPPPGWVYYIVYPGDTLFSLGLRLGVTVSELQYANCLGDSTNIRAGQRLYVPFLPPSLPTRTGTPTLTPSPTQTASPQPPTNTPTSTPSPTPTREPTATETSPPSNQPPSISNIPAQQTDEDVPSGPIAFTARDAQTPANQLIISATSSNPVLIPEGNIIFSGSGAQRTVNLIPAENQFGSADITIFVQDADGAIASETFTLTVNPVNDDPVAMDDSATIPPDTTLLLDVLVNDYDVDGDPLSISIESAPQHGSVSVDGILVIYIPDPGFSGSDTFSYSISDGNGGTDSAQVSVTIE